MTTSSTMKCCDVNCMRRWPLTSFGSYRPGPYPHKGKGVCVRDVCAIYDNNISPSLLMIMIKIIILYSIQIRHTDDFPPTGTLLVIINFLILGLFLTGYGCDVHKIHLGYIVADCRKEKYIREEVSGDSAELHRAATGGLTGLRATSESC